MSTSKMIFYRDMEHEELFESMARMLEKPKLADEKETSKAAAKLIDLAVTYGFEGNLWHCFLALCLANHENAYTTSCEIRGNAGGTLDQLARQDFAVFQELFREDVRTLGGALWECICNYIPGSRTIRAERRD